MADGEQIKLGEQTFAVVPQGIGRIRRKMEALTEIQEGSAEVDGEFNNQVYDLLKTFIPDLPAQWKLLGYESQEQYEADEEPDAAASAQSEPTLPQILDAIDTVFKVNGGDRLVRLGKSILGDEGAQLLVRKAVLGAFSPN